MVSVQDIKNFTVDAGKMIALYIAVYTVYWVVAQVYIESCAPRTLIGFVRSMVLSASPWCTGLLSVQTTLLNCLSNWFAGVIVIVCAMFSRLLTRPEQNIQNN